MILWQPNLVNHENQENFRFSFKPIQRRGEDKKALLLKICHTYPTMMKLGTVIPYLKKIQKIYKSCNTPLEFC